MEYTCGAGSHPIPRLDVQYSIPITAMENYIPNQTSCLSDLQTRSAPVRFQAIGGLANHYRWWRLHLMNSCGTRVNFPCSMLYGFGNMPSGKVCGIGRIHEKFQLSLVIHLQHGSVQHSIFNCHR